MHELGIAQNIVEIVTKELESHSLKKRVERIIFKTGKMNMVLPDSLTFHFDILKEDHFLLKDAVLEIEEIPAVARCHSCDRSFPLDRPFFICPDCNGPAAIESGDQMWIESIFVEDNEEGDKDGN
jgi:hydrogenase nickel incorporation protein HypA/HybF